MGGVGGTSPVETAKACVDRIRSFNAVSGSMFMISHCSSVGGEGASALGETMGGTRASSAAGLGAEGWRPTGEICVLRSCAILISL